MLKTCVLFLACFEVIFHMLVKVSAKLLTSCQLANILFSFCHIPNRIDDIALPILYNLYII